MNFSEDQLIAYLVAFFWPFLRISSMFLSMPVISVNTVPAKLKVFLSLLITMTLYPVLPQMPDIPPFSAAGWMVTVQQLLIGLATGFILQMVFSIMLFAGQSIAYSMGLGFASLVDPTTGVQTPVIAQLFIIASSLTFLAVDGHLLLIEMLAQSFYTLPVAVSGLQTDDLWRMISWSSQIFAGGLLLALPVISTLLFVNICFGIASKAAPQLQLFGVGFPITILLGMALVWIGIVEMLDAFTDMLQQGFKLVGELLRLS
ncbi:MULTISPECIES: flagellar biosynthetic protein FliR [Methylomonas]|uniref:flagellar biosynthetic protein FliR n=1 Tax=Methylomonas TaxID=416 RepID=UPI0012319E6C|nr:flagellar biosynthetic protein FliR [Methylomonas rhizoryzae]